MAQRDESVKRMYLELRLSTREVARALGVSHMTVQRDLKRMGVERRGKGRGKAGAR